MSKIDEIERAINILMEIENYQRDKLLTLYGNFKDFPSGDDIVNKVNMDCFKSITNGIGKLEYWRREEIDRINCDNSGVVKLFGIVTE